MLETAANFRHALATIMSRITHGDRQEECPLLKAMSILKAIAGVMTSCSPLAGIKRSLHNKKFVVASPQLRELFLSVTKNAVDLLGRKSLPMSMQKRTKSSMKYSTLNGNPKAVDVNSSSMYSRSNLHHGIQVFYTPFNLDPPGPNRFRVPLGCHVSDTGNHLNVFRLRDTWSTTTFPSAVYDKSFPFTFHNVQVKGPLLRSWGPSK